MEMPLALPSQFSYGFRLPLIVPELKRGAKCQENTSNGGTRSPMNVPSALAHPDLGRHEMGLGRLECQVSSKR